MTAYKELDFRLTFDRLRTYFVEHNAHLRIESPEEYRKRSLKSTHLETLKEIVRFYGAHLYKNINKGLDPNRRFWVTNTGLAGKKLQHRVTIYRHIEILIAAGVIHDKIFHGSNSGIELVLNTDLFVYKVSLADASLGNCSIIADDLKNEKQCQTDELRPCVATSMDTNPGGFKETYNTNKGGGFVDFLETGAFTSEQSHNLLSWKQGKRPQEPEQKPGDFRAGPAQPSRPGDCPKWSGLVKLCTMQAWKFAKGVLWPQSNFSHSDEKLTQKKISEYFSLVPANNLERSAGKLYRWLCERVVLAKRFVDRSPERFVPKPWVWFDKHFKQGFAGTKQWHENLRKGKKASRKQYENLRGFMQLFKFFDADPTISAYKKCENHLKELKDDFLLKLFYQCVQDRELISSGHLHTYYKYGNAHIAQ